MPWTRTSACASSLATPARCATWWCGRSRRVATRNCDTAPGNSSAAAAWTRRPPSTIGYLHLRAMNAADMAEWQRAFYPVHGRQGLVIDLRRNTGGNIDSWLLSRLLRQAWFYWQPRTGQATPNMPSAYRGHIAVLVDQETASDGEAFAEGVRRLGLGVVIGTRTWGGEIWGSGRQRAARSRHGDRARHRRLQRTGRVADRGPRRRARRRRGQPARRRRSAARMRSSRPRSPTWSSASAKRRCRR